jgi:hypothetical protein
MFEVPLRMLAVYGLWNMLNPEGGACDEGAATLAQTLSSWRIFDLLRQFLSDAHHETADQSAEALSEIRHGCFMLAERVFLLLQRSNQDISSIISAPAAAAAPPLEPNNRLHPPASSGISTFVAHTIVCGRPTVPIEGCSLLLCFLQDDAQRELVFHSELRDAYRKALECLRNALDCEIQQACNDSGRTEPPSAAYYAQLQIAKYQSELDG